MLRFLHLQLKVETKGKRNSNVGFKFKAVQLIKRRWENFFQCSGKLASLAFDDVVKSIGLGSTDKLSSIFQELQDSGKNSNDSELRFIERPVPTKSLYVKY